MFLEGMKKHRQASKKGDEPQRSKGGSSSMRRGVRYGECQKNHAANMGGFALDGCKEFMASGEDGTSGALRCAACGCHRNFHRPELDREETNNLKDKEMTSENAAAVMLSGGSFEKIRQRIWECLKDPKVGRFSFHGWKGVGRSVFLRQVIDELSKQTKSHDEEEDEEGRSDTVYQIVWVRAPGSVGDVRISISRLISQNEDYLNLGVKTLYNIPNQKILLVLDDLRQFIDLDDVGFLEWKSMVWPGSKVVITSHSKQIWSEMKSIVNIEESWEGLSDDEAWGLLRSEVTDMANSLASFNINIGGDALMQCYTYLFLFPNGTPSNYFGSYWRTERLIGSFESWEKTRIIFRSLIPMLVNRAMILGSDDEKHIQVSKSIVSKVVPILNRQGRCLVRCGLELEEAPKVDEWEKDNLKRISLASNRITTLGGQVGRPPNVPQLSTLILSKNRLLQEVSDDFFHNMQGLRVLDLSSTGIKSLPSSLSTLTNLRLLALSNCPNLETLPIHLLHALQNLEALHLFGSPFPKLTQLSLDMMQHLCRLEITGASNLTQLSLRGCRSFEVLFPPKNLEILDLSSTKISEFDYFDFWNLTCLRRLDLLDTKHLQVVPWHEINRLPQTLNWDHCSNHSSAKELHTNQGYCISVSDDKIFESLSKDSKLWEEYFKKFKFSVVSCDQRQQRQPKDAKYPFERTHFIYRGIYEAKTKYFTQFPEFTKIYDRCLEIDSTNVVPYSIRGVLYHTEFLSLCGNNSIIRLSQLGVENLDSLIECRLEKCLNMQHLITTGRTTINVEALSRIEILSVLDLTNLKSLCRGTLGEGSFARLKRMCLEHCHRLSILFSSSVCLEKLEKLEIKFCYKLESLFEEDVEGQDVFPQLKELYLLKLPKLKCICNGNLPELEKLKAHGCRLLHKFPLPIATGNKLNTVVIGGNQEWKKNLKWEEQLINQGVKLKVPRAFKV